MANESKATEDVIAHLRGVKGCAVCQQAADALDAKDAEIAKLEAREIRTQEICRAQTREIERLRQIVRGMDCCDEPVDDISICGKTVVNAYCEEHDKR